MQCPISKRLLQDEFGLFKLLNDIGQFYFWLLK